MRSIRVTIWMCCVGILLSGPVMAIEEDSANLPWKKASLNLGWYWANFDSGFSIRSERAGIGINLDGEDTLGLDNDDNALRVGAGWRFTKKQTPQF